MKTPHVAEQGVTLVELLVSMAIGLVIMIAIGQTYLSSSSASRIVEMQARMNEDAQAALTMMAQQLQLAGANPVRGNRAEGFRQNSFTSTYVIRACDVAFSNTSSANSIDGLTCSHTSGSAGPDALGISYEADAFNTTTTSGGTPADCVGNGLPATSFAYKDAAGVDQTTNVYIANPVYYVNTATYTLSCRSMGSSGTAQPLIGNIEDLQIRLGVAADDTSRSVAGYLSAQELENAPSLAALSAANHWKAVRTIQICILMRTDEPVVAKAADARYYDCSGTEVTSPPDLRLRRAYKTTVLLKNQ